MAEYIEREAALNAINANKSSTELAWIAVSKIPSANTNPECFSPEENNPYPLCVGKDMPECENCQLRADWEPDN